MKIKQDLAIVSEEKLISAKRSREMAENEQPTELIGSILRDKDITNTDQLR